MNRFLNIRPAAIGEYERLAVLWKGVEHLHHHGLPHIFRKPDEEAHTRAAVESLIIGPDSAILIAEANTEIVGFVALRVHRVEQTSRMRRRTFVLIENMAVERLYRRRGVGRTLLRAAEEWTTRRGIAVLQLFVWEFNDAAVRFYQSEGFVTELRGMARRSKSIQDVSEKDGPSG